MAPSDRGESQNVPLLIAFRASWLKPYALLCPLSTTLEREWLKSLIEGRTRVCFLKCGSSCSLSGNRYFYATKGKMANNFVMKLAHGFALLSWALYKLLLANMLL